MKEKSPSEIWEEFSESIMYGNRFFPENQELFEVFNKVLSKLARYSSGHFNKVDNFYRARKGWHDNEGELRNPDPKKVNIPDGRCNPRGVSYFYLSSEEDTCISEVKPMLKDVISIGKFKLKEDLELNICNFNIVKVLNEDEISRLKLTEKEAELLQIILKELSKPINHEETLHYILSQYIVEFIKHDTGRDGFSFKSSCDNKTNFVFFNDEKFELSGDINHIIVDEIYSKYSYSHLKKID